METPTFAEIIGSIAKWFVIGTAILGVLYLLAILIRPVIGQISETFSMVSSGGHKDIHSVAVLCILLIGAIGLAKVLTRKK